VVVCGLERYRLWLISSILDRMIGTNRCWGVTRTEVVAADWSMFLFEFKTSRFMG
jgi:hypothetical protein